jgi:hypothetical protein
MANFCLFISESDGTRIPNSELQFSLKANIGDTFVWQDSNVFTGLTIGSTHYFGIKKRSNGLILIEGDAFIVGNNSEPYEAIFEDVSEIIIPQSEHGKNKVASVTIIDSQDSIIGNNPTILREAPDEETVIINFDEPQTVTVRIL